MSDYEKAALFAEYLSVSNSVFSNYMALVFGMLAASFFVASKMSRAVMVLFLVLYNVVALQAGSGVVFAFTDFANLGVFIHQTAASGGTELGWLGPAGPGGAGMGMMPFFVTAMVLFTHLGTLVFFVVVRRNRLSKDTELA